MRAVALSPDGTLEVVDKPEPDASAGHVVVAVERCGICGSDLHMRSARLLPPGAVMGHEFAGTVAQVGDDVAGLAEGQRVSVLPAVQCGTCEACLAGRGQLCATQAATSLGLGMNDGAYAEYVRAAAVSCFPLPEGMTADQGALVEPYAVGLHAVRRSRCLRSDSAVGIIGAGPIGLMTLAALRATGHTAVAVAERSESRATVAEAMGASVTNDATRLDQALGQMPDVVFECAGTGATASLALQLARPGGEVVLVGVANPDDPVSLMSVMWVVKEVDYTPSIGYSAAEFGKAVEAVAGGAVDPAVVVSAVRSLEEAEASFSELATATGPVKVLLTPAS